MPSGPGCREGCRTWSGPCLTPFSIGERPAFSGLKSSPVLEPEADWVSFISGENRWFSGRSSCSKVPSLGGSTFFHHRLHYRLHHLHLPHHLCATSPSTLCSWWPESLVTGARAFSTFTSLLLIISLLHLHLSSFSLLFIFLLLHLHLCSMHFSASCHFTFASCHFTFSSCFHWRWPESLVTGATTYFIFTSLHLLVFTPTPQLHAFFSFMSLHLLFVFSPALARVAGHWGHNLPHLHLFIFLILHLHLSSMSSSPSASPNLLFTSPSLHIFTRVWLLDEMDEVSV